MVAVEGEPTSGKQLVVACRWVRSVRPHHRRSMDAKGPQTRRASSVDLHVAQLRAQPVDAQHCALRILFFGLAIRRQSFDVEIAGLEYSVIIRRDGGSAGRCRRLVTTVKAAAVDNRRTIDRVLCRAPRRAWASLPFPVCPIVSPATGPTE